jgi:hypothetical protein
MSADAFNVLVVLLAILGLCLTCLALGIQVGAMLHRNSNGDEPAPNGLTSHTFKALSRDAARTHADARVRMADDAAGGDRFREDGRHALTERTWIEGDSTLPGASRRVSSSWRQPW